MACPFCGAPLDVTIERAPLSPASGAARGPSRRGLRARIGGARRWLAGWRARLGLGGPVSLACACALAAGGEPWVVLAGPFVYG